MPATRTQSRIDHDDYTRSGYLTTMDAIEGLSGLYFLSGLPDEVEERLEAVKATRLW